MLTLVEKGDSHTPESQLGGIFVGPNFSDINI